MSKQETTQPEKIIQGRNQKLQANVSQGKQRTKAHNQRQLNQSKRPYDRIRFYGVVVINLDCKSKDLSLTRGRTFPQLIFEDFEKS